MDKEKLIEAALFMSGRRMTREELQKVSGLSEKRFDASIEFLEKKYRSLDIAMTLTKNADGWKLEVRDEYLPHVRKLSSLTELNSGEIKTLSVIAYYRPITQSDVVKIRGNRAYSHISRLEGLGLITSRPQGRTKILTVTERFREYFGKIDKLEI